MNTAIVIAGIVMAWAILQLIIDTWFFGWPITNHAEQDALAKALTSARLNPFNPNILSLSGENEGIHVARMPCAVNPYFAYYVSGYGTVLRGTPLHRAIKQRFAELDEL